MKKFSAETWSLALCIAILPPIWAVLAPYLSVDVGAVALICAGLYVTNGNKLMDAPRITIGFLLGDLWGWLAVNAMQNSSWNADVTTFMTLFLLGGAAVIIAAMGSEMIHCPSWLCGWAITLTVLAPLEQGLQGSYAIQIAVAMTVGVWYVGAFLNTVQQCILRFTEGHTSNDINFAGRKSSWMIYLPRGALLWSKKVTVLDN